MKKLSIILILATSACGLEPLTEYVPIVDPYRVDEKKFTADLGQCRTLALRVEADYRKRQEEQMLQNMAVGLIAGALTGAVVGAGSDYQGELAAYGAVAGASAGANTNDYTYDLVKFGPRRVVDRCMTNRGHELLNDIGRD